MRISGQVNDSGFETYQKLLRSNLKITICVDGKPHYGVITADEEEGFILIDTDGPEPEIIKGKVEINTATVGRLH